MNEYNCSVASSFILQLMTDKINVCVYLDDGNCLNGIIDYYEKNSDGFILNGNKLIVLSKIRRIEPDLDHRDWKFKPPLVVSKKSTSLSNSVKTTADLSNKSIKEVLLLVYDSRVEVQITLDTLIPDCNTPGLINYKEIKLNGYITKVDTQFECIDIKDAGSCEFGTITQVLVDGLFIWNKVKLDLVSTKHDRTMIMLQRTLSDLLKTKTVFSVTALGNTFETHVLTIDPIFSAVELYSTLECGCRLHFMDIDNITVYDTIVYDKEI